MNYTLKINFFIFIFYFLNIWWGNNDKKMNLLNISNFTTIHGTETIYLNDMLRDLAFQLDDKISLIITLFIISWFMVYVILPRALIGIKEVYPIFSQGVETIFGYVISLFETFGILCTLAIYYICYVQGLIRTSHLITVYLVLGLMVIVFYAEKIHPKVRAWLK